MRHCHKWEELLPEEFYEEFARAPIAYWGCGGMEDHGLHNALGADPYVAYDLCLRTADIAGGIVFPPVPFALAGIPGLSREELRSREPYTYPPSLWVSREVCEQLYLELLESLADLGFRACLAAGDTTRPRCSCRSCASAPAAGSARCACGEDGLGTSACQSCRSSRSPMATG